MLAIEFPEPEFRTRDDVGGRSIFDPLRRRWLQLTPEEWVRQNFINYLIRVKNYPATLIAQEKLFRLGELNKRFDILVYDPMHKPWLMIECKSPSVQLNNAVLHQLLRYHISVPAGYLIITNGTNSYGWLKNEGVLQPISSLPDWKF